MVQKEYIKEYFEDISIDDMPNEDIKEIAELIGIENTIKVLERFAGITITLPTKWNKKFIEKYVLKHHDGSKESYKKICGMFNISERHIQKLVKAEKDNKKVYNK